MVRPLVATLCASLALATSAAAQSGGLDRASNLVVPQRGTMLLEAGRQRLALSEVHANVEIAQDFAVVTLDIGLTNSSSRIEEAVLLVPVPDDAVVRGFDFIGASAEPTAQVLPRDTARDTYDAIVQKVRDPALLEFAGRASLQSSVFPVPANGTQRVRVVYEHMLHADGDRLDWVLPRSTDVQAARIPWSIDIRLTAAAPIGTAYSPTHDLDIDRLHRREYAISLDQKAMLEPGPVRISYMLEGDGLTASLYAYPDSRVGGGYFLMLASLPDVDAEEAEPVPREMLIVLDTSGSMKGPKFEQARAAALSVLEGLDEGESFNIIDYESNVSQLFAKPTAKDGESMAAARAYLDRLEANGGTAIDGALRVALDQPHADGTLPLVLFLTDGLPTVGPKSEMTIRENAEEANEHDRRIFTFGVGDDVNAPLLDALANATRAYSTYVGPNQDIEIAVSSVEKRLQGPLFASPELEILDGAGDPAPHRVADVLPGLMPDVYEGDRILVVGQYRGDETLIFDIEGQYLGEQRDFRFRFELDQASLGNDFVARMWASKKIAHLVEEIRQQGADPTTAMQAGEDGPAATQEMVREILTLSTRHGILTEYTAFLALEGTDLSNTHQLVAQLNTHLRQRAQGTRTGRGAVAQARNQGQRMRRGRATRRNQFLDANGDAVSIPGVRPIGDRTFYRRGDTWIDGRLLRTGVDLEVPEDEQIAFASPEHRELVTRLIREERQGVMSLRGRVLLEIDGACVELPRGGELVAAAE